MVCDSQTNESEAGLIARNVEVEAEIQIISLTMRQWQRRKQQAGSWRMELQRLQEQCGLLEATSTAQGNGGRIVQKIAMLSQKLAVYGHERQENLPLLRAMAQRIAQLQERAAA